MACAGVIASAGAQLDFTVMTVERRTHSAGKSSFVFFGFDSATGTGSLSNNTIEFADGTAYTCTSLEDEVNVLSLFMGSTVSDDDTSFRRLVIDGTASLNRSDRTQFASNEWRWNYAGTEISSKENSTVTIEWRAD